METVTVSNTVLEKLAQHYFNWHNQHWSRKWEYPWVASRIADLTKSTHTVLDAGAGLSPVALFAIDRVKKVITVDSHRQTGKGAGYHDYSQWEDGIESHKANLSDMPVRASSVHLITCVSVIEHMAAETRRATFAEFARVLRKNGHLVMTVDLVGDRGRLLNKCAGRLVEDETEHGRYDEVILELVNAGFEILAEVDCPITRREKGERTTHVVGIVAKWTHHPALETIEEANEYLPPPTPPDPPEWLLEEIEPVTEIENVPASEDNDVVPDQIQEGDDARL